MTTRISFTRFAVSRALTLFIRGRRVATTGLAALAISAILSIVGAVSASAQTAIIPDDPGCVGKFRGEICKIYDGTNSGGVCVPSRCGKGDRPCLKCEPVPPETRATDGDLWVPMLSFGIIVTIIGGIFWLRLKRNWDKKETP